MIPQMPEIQDAHNFEKIPENHVRDFLTYAINSTRLIHDSIMRCDTKAAAQIPVSLTFYGGYYLWIKNYVSRDSLLLIAFYFNTALVALSILFSILCLWVRNIPLPPSIPNVLIWLNGKDNETVQTSLFSSIFFNLAEAEYKSFKVVLSKSHMLRLSQMTLLVFLLVVLISAIICVTLN